MCSLSLSLNIGITGTNDAYIKKAGTALALTAAAWVVSLGGLASLQDEALAADADVNVVPAKFVGVNGFSPILDGKTIYRFWWFVVAIQLVTMVIAAVVLTSGSINKARGMVVGLLSVCALLYMNFGDAFYTLQETMDGGVTRDRLRALLAGVIMTAVLDCVCVFLFGWEAPKAEAEVSVAL